jgi:hypothetical protein
MDRPVCLVIRPPYLPDRSRNSALFRHVNDRIREVSGTWGNLGPIGFLCECGDPDCTAVINLAVKEFEMVRSAPGRFVVVRGHEHSGAETVVASEEGYLIVERRAEVTAAA